MKVLYFIFTITLMYTYAANAQIPDYFENQQAWTSEKYVGPDLSGDDLHHYYDSRFYVNNDTIIGEHTYKNIERYMRHTTSAMAGPDDVEITVATEIFARQEGRSIYFFHEGVDSLFISYDLSLGDTVGGYFGAINPNKTVHTIDSVLVGDHYRRLFYTDTDEDPFPDSRLLEGIGHLGGEGGYFFASTLYGEYWELSISNTLNCYGEEHIQLWPNEGGTCHPSLTLNLAEAENIAIAVFPNPVDNFLQITMDENIKLIQLFSIEGTEIYNSTVNANQHRIELADLSKGVYLVRITSENGVEERHKIIKR